MIFNATVYAYKLNSMWSSHGYSYLPTWYDSSVQHRKLYLPTFFGSGVFYTESDTLLKRRINRYIGLVMNLSDDADKLLFYNTFSTLEIYRIDINEASMPNFTSLDLSKFPTLNRSMNRLKKYLMSKGLIV